VKVKVDFMVRLSIMSFIVEMDAISRAVKRPFSDARLNSDRALHESFVS